MVDNKLTLKTGVVALIILIAALSRLIPHPMNFTPIAGIGMFGAAYFSRKWLAFLIPFIAMWLSDLVINNIYYPIVFPQYYEGFTLFTSGWYWMYGAFALIIGLGYVLLKKVSAGNLLITSLLASCIFFIITNFGVWFTTPIYAGSGMAGLLAAYELAIPFFWNTLAGDLFYVSVMFGSYELIKTKYPSLAV